MLPYPPVLVCQLRLHNRFVQVHDRNNLLRSRRARHYANLSAKRGTTPLMMACAYGHTHCVRYLISIGADPWQQNGTKAGHSRTQRDFPHSLN